MGIIEPFGMGTPPPPPPREKTDAEKAAEQAANDAMFMSADGAGLGDAATETAGEAGVAAETEAKAAADSAERDAIRQLVADNEEGKQLSDSDVEWVMQNGGADKLAGDYNNKKMEAAQKPWPCRPGRRRKKKSATWCFSIRALRLIRTTPTTSLRWTG
ncbi:MAG: hypothetical protein AB7P76_12380 [Candidatus Melainabacteria bacterium]